MRLLDTARPTSVRLIQDWLDEARASMRLAQILREAGIKNSEEAAELGEVMGSFLLPDPFDQQDMDEADEILGQGITLLLQAERFGYCENPGPLIRRALQRHCTWAGGGGEPIRNGVRLTTRRVCEALLTSPDEDGLNADERWLSYWPELNQAVRSRPGSFTRRIQEAGAQAGVPIAVAVELLLKENLDGHDNGASEGQRQAEEQGRIVGELREMSGEERRLTGRLSKLRGLGTSGAPMTAKEILARPGT